MSARLSMDKLLHWIVSAGMPGMAATETADPKDDSLQDAMLLNGFFRVR